jgi:two-component system cell cycle sensor histidine kinase/response regulator CckA
MIYQSQDAKRESLHLWIAISIMLVLSAYRLSSALASQLEAFFRAYTELPVAESLSNVLFFWLLLLLWVAYRRWKSTIFKNDELEQVLTSISPDSIAVVTPERTITMCSGQIESMFGYKGQELIGQQTDTLYYDRRLRGERGEIANRLERFGFHVGYATGKHKDGQTFPMEIVTGTMEGHKGAVILMRDITERINTEKALLNSEKRFDLFMRYLPGSAFVKSADGKYIYLNCYYERVNGWNLSNSIDKTDFDLYPRELAEQLVKADETVLRENRDMSYVTRSMQQGEPRSMLTYKFPIPAPDDGLPMIGGISLDITEQEKAQEDRRKIEKQMQQAQKLESLGVLGGGIAHDFNNLLMGMLGHADLALTKLQADDPARQHIEEVVASAQRAADLANQLLAYSGEGKFVVETVDLSDVVREMSNLLEVSITKTSNLKLDLNAEMPATRCDTTQIRQVIMNLIVNASDALDDKPGDISIATGSANRTTSDFADTYLGSKLPDGEYAYIKISDTGMGIDEATRNRIFDPFFTTKFAGRGLGLAAVMGIIRSHNGAISLKSALGEGTHFTIYLPTSEELVPVRPTTDGSENSWKGSGTILVADDEEVVRDVAKLMLKTIGFEVETASNGREAVEAFVLNPNQFTAVLLDLTMPEMGGLEAYEKIRALDEHIPVILSSGYNKQDEVEHFLDATPPLFLKKPYRLDSIRSIFQSCLSQ